MANTPSHVQQVIQKVNEEVIALKVQMETVRGETSSFVELATRIAVLEHQVEGLRKLLEIQGDVQSLKGSVDGLNKWKDEQKKAQEERTRRWFALTPNLLAAIITVTGGVFNIILAALIAYFVSRKP